MLLLVWRQMLPAIVRKPEFSELYRLGPIIVWDHKIFFELLKSLDLETFNRTGVRCVMKWETLQKYEGFQGVFGLAVGCS